MRPLSLVGRYRSGGENTCVHLQVICLLWGLQVPLRW